MPVAGTGAPPRQSNPAQLHLFLGIGLVVTAAALGVTRYLTSGLAPDPASLITFIMAGVSVSMAGAALMFLKGQVPEPRGGQTSAQYWADPKVAGPAMMFWFILEGAGVVASVGYFLEGSAIAALLALFVIATFWMNGPRAFDRE